MLNTVIFVTALKNRLRMKERGKKSMTPEENLKKLGIVLPTPPKSKGSYRGCVRAGNLVFVSGQGPAQKGTPAYIGKVGRDISAEEGYESARICGINLLAQLKEWLGELNKIEQIVSIRGFVNSTDRFWHHSAVIDGASDLMIQVFGEEKGSHSRCALGVESLPGNIATEVEMIVKVGE